MDRQKSKYIFFPPSLFNILSSFSYILIYNSYLRYSTILFSLFNYNFIYLRLFLFSPSLFLLILNFYLYFYLILNILFISFSPIFRSSFFSSFFHFSLSNTSSSFLFFLLFFTISHCSSNLLQSSVSFFLLILSTLFPAFYNFLFPIFQLQSSLLSSNLHSSSASFSCQPFLTPLRPLPFPCPSPNLLPLLAENAATDAAAAMNNGFRTQPCQLPPPRLNIHNAFLRRVRYEILHVQPRSTRRARARETGRRLWTGNKRVRTHRETHRRCREAWIVDKAPTILAGPAQHSCCLACFEYEIVRAENHAWF